jgi:plastocyanin
MKPLNSMLSSTIIRCMLPLAGLIVPETVHGATWRATAGVERADLGMQGLAFLPNELWVHAGDGITWTLATDEIHTVSFLTSSQLRPVGPHRNDVITPDGSPFDGSSYVNSGDLAVGQTYTVKFPTAGNFKLVCLVHLYMNGTIHVLKPSEPLPHNQASYDRQATDESNQLLSGIQDPGDNEQNNSASHRVIGGTGEIVATGGGFQSASVMRFFPKTITAHVGQPLEWTNFDPQTPHTITFGFPVEPTPPRFPVPIVSSGVGVNQTLDSDGALHATVGFPTDNVHSGFVFALPADRAVNGPNAGLLATDPPDLSQFPLPVVVKDVNQRFRVTFTHPGTFNYRCVLHDDLGMVGQVIVLP